MRPRARAEGGVALILALLLLAILIVLVGQLTITTLHNRTVAENQLADLQNTLGLRSGYHRAKLFLQADAERAAAVDSVNEAWAAPVEFDLGKAHVKVAVQDSERLLDLSHLVDDNGERQTTVSAQLKRLASLLLHPPDVAERILDYVDADTKGDYEAGARNARLLNLEELLRIPGVPPGVLYGGLVEGLEKKGLLEFVTIWPRTLPAAPGAVNANTAPAEVLAALSEKMSLALAQAIVQARGARNPDGTYQEVQAPEDLKKVSGMTDEVFASLAGLVLAKSSTFEVKVRSAVGNVEKAWTYVVTRTPEGTSLLGAQRTSDFLSVRPPEEEKE
jgi:general secretion pathway protein K